MTPPILHELLDELDAFMRWHEALLVEDSEEYFRLLRRFVVYLICRSDHEGRSNALAQLTKPQPN